MYLDLKTASYITNLSRSGALLGAFKEADLLVLWGIPPLFSMSESSISLRSDMLIPMKIFIYWEVYRRKFREKNHNLIISLAVVKKHCPSQLYPRRLCPFLFMKSFETVRVLMILWIYKYTGNTYLDLRRSLATMYNHF